MPAPPALIPEPLRIFPEGFFVPRGLEQINFEILQISKLTFGRKTWLSLLPIPVWLRCRQRGQPFGLPVGSVFAACRTVCGVRVC